MQPPIRIYEYKFSHIQRGVFLTHERATGSERERPKLFHPGGRRYAVLLQAARAAPWPACIAWYHCVPVQVSQAGHGSLLFPGSCVRHTMPPACAGPLGAIFSVSTCPLGVGLLLVLLCVSPGLVPAALSVLPITNGGYRTDWLPGLCTCICPLSPARCGPAACSPLRGSVCHSCYAGVFSHRAARGPSGAPGAVACWVSAVSGSFSHTRESNGV